MLKTLTREVALSIQARSGVTAAVLVWMALASLATLVAFAFVCVAGYDALAAHFDPVTAGLIMAGIFVVIALFAALVCALLRRRTRERAILARAARAHGSSWLLDPKILTTAVEAGRTIGWQRIVPVALLGFMAALWAREYRDRAQERDL